MSASAGSGTTPYLSRLAYTPWRALFHACFAEQPKSRLCANDSRTAPRGRLANRLGFDDFMRAESVPEGQKMTSLTSTEDDSFMHIVVGGPLAVPFAASALFSIYEPLTLNWRDWMGCIASIAALAFSMTAFAASYTVTVLGTLAGGGSFARGINNRGQVVGNSGGRAFLYTDGSMRDLDPQFGGNNVAYAINNLGQVVGSSQDTGGHLHAFLYSGDTTTPLPPRPPLARPPRFASASANVQLATREPLESRSNVTRISVMRTPKRIWRRSTIVARTGPATSDSSRSAMAKRDKSSARVDMVTTPR
jgi:probable HAF family extracellular repeat protein